MDPNNVLDDLQQKAWDYAQVPNQVSTEITLNHFHFQASWQQDFGVHASFTGSKHEMRVNENYQMCNATAQLKDNNNLHSFWNHALQLQEAHEVLMYKYLCLYLMANVDFDRYIVISMSYQKSMNKCSHTFVLLTAKNDPFFTHRVLQMTFISYLTLTDVLCNC